MSVKILILQIQEYQLVCQGCRLEFFSKKAVLENKTFSIPRYLQFVVAPEKSRSMSTRVI